MKQQEKKRATKTGEVDGWKVGSGPEVHSTSGIDRPKFGAVGIWRTKSMPFFFLDKNIFSSKSQDACFGEVKFFWESIAVFFAPSPILLSTTLYPRHLHCALLSYNLPIFYSKQVRNTIEWERIHDP